MRVNREELLKVLTIAKVGLTQREILEQSNSFVFTEKHMITFNGEILTRVATPLEDMRGAIPAADFMALLQRFPDEEVEILAKGEEVRIKAKRRNAGITRVLETALVDHVADVPVPKVWKGLPSALMGTLVQASRACGKDETKFFTTVVHVLPKQVEGCDNTRLFRSRLKTRVKGELLVPAVSLDSVGGIPFTRFSHTGGWLHLRTKEKHSVSVRLAEGEAYPNVDSLLEVESPRKVQLPGNLSEILSRAEIMHEVSADNDPIVRVTIERGMLTLRARKDSGWYREEKRIKYKGAPLRFLVNPKLLQEVLTKTRQVVIDGTRMKIEAGKTVFVVCLLERDKEDSDGE